MHVNNDILPKFALALIFSSLLGVQIIRLKAINANSVAFKRLPKSFKCHTDLHLWLSI